MTLYPTPDSIEKVLLLIGLIVLLGIIAVFLDWRKK